MYSFCTYYLLSMHTKFYTFYYAYYHTISKNIHVYIQLGIMWGSMWCSPQLSCITFGISCKDQPRGPHLEDFWEGEDHMILADFSCNSPLQIRSWPKLKSCSSWAIVFCLYFLIFFGAMSDFLWVFWWTPVL